MKYFRERTGLELKEALEAVKKRECQIVSVSEVQNIMNDYIYACDDVVYNMQVAAERICDLVSRNYTKVSS